MNGSGMQARVILVLIATVLTLMGCQGPMPVARIASAPGNGVQTPGTLPRILDPHREVIRASFPGKDAPYMLDSGDRIRVEVFGQADLSRVYPVDGGGFVSIPLIGGVKARGFTSFQMEQRIAGELRKKFIKDPKVTVEVATFRPFFILGEVRNPGQFAYVNDMNVLTAVAIAGGFTERAREKSVRVTRRVRGNEVSREVASDFTVRPGDIIYVKERFF